MISTFLLVTSTLAQAQQNYATIITKAQVDEGLKLPTTSIDRMVRIVDLGSYQLAIAVAKWGLKVPDGPPNTKPIACGVSTMPKGMNAVPTNGISHDDITETYVIISGSGTLVTGGQILNGIHSTPDSEGTRILNGPSCIGPIVGNVARNKVSTGDIVIIPAGVPHGWANLAAPMEYLTVRSDPKKVLQHGYVNPDIK